MKRVFTFGLLLAAAILVFGRTTHAFAASVDAIAIDDDRSTASGDAGWGTGEGDTVAAAKKMALENCAKEGNKHCKVMLTYKKCGAYASSANYYGTGTGATKAAAKEDAMKNCGHNGCKVAVSDCVGDE